MVGQEKGGEMGKGEGEGKKIGEKQRAEMRKWMVKKSGRGGRGRAVNSTS